MALRVRKSVSDELTFAKFFDKVDFLDLAKSDFLDLVDFAIVERLLILLPIHLPAIISTPPSKV